MLSKDTIISMIYPDKYIMTDLHGEPVYNDKYYFTPNNTPIKKRKDLFNINNKLNVMYGYLLGSFESKLIDYQDTMTERDIRSVKNDINLCRQVIKNLIQTTREIAINAEEDLTNEQAALMYKAANEELREIYRIVPDYVKAYFSSIIHY